MRRWDRDSRALADGFRGTGMQAGKPLLAWLVLLVLEPGEPRRWEKKKIRRRQGAFWANKCRRSSRSSREASQPTIGREADAGRQQGMLPLAFAAVCGEFSLRLSISNQGDTVLFLQTEDGKKVVESVLSTPACWPFGGELKPMGPPRPRTAMGWATSDKPELHMRSLMR